MARPLGTRIDRRAAGSRQRPHFHRVLPASYGRYLPKVVVELRDFWSPGHTPTAIADGQSSLTAAISDNRHL